MIAVCGEALIDFMPLESGDEHAYRLRPGGSPCNVAIGLARLGNPTAFIGKISTDRFGDILHSHLTQNGVDLQWLVRGSEPSALAFVITAPNGGHDFAFYGRDTAEQRFTHDDIPATFPDEVSALHFGSYSLMLGSGATAYEALMRRESRSRAISLDPNVRPTLFSDRALYRQRIERLLKFAAIVKASADDLAWLYPDERPEDTAARWLNSGPSVVVITLGADGAIGLSSNGIVSVAGIRVNVVDAVGAGDAFTAAFLARLEDNRLLNRNSLAALPANALEDALEYANHAAALTCARLGADPPTISQLEQWNRRGL